MNLKNTLLSLLLVGSLMFPKLAKGIGMYGCFIDAPAESVKVYRKPTGPVDTLRTITESHGDWSIATENFNPLAVQGETLYVENKDKTAKTYMIRGPPEYWSLDLNLNKHTACIENVHDSTHFNSAPLNLIYWIDGFQPETTQIDTGLGFNFYDVHAGFDKSQAVHGAQAHFKFEKARAETLFYRNFHFTIDTTRFDAQLVKDTLYFTKDSMIIGVPEQNKDIVKKENLVKQSHGTRFDIQGSWELYDLIGNKVSEYQTDTNAYKSHNLGMNPNGRYFLKSKDGKDLIEQIIIFKK